MKIPRSLSIGLLSIVAVMLFLFSVRDTRAGNALGIAVWKQARLGALASWLAPHDAELAFAIGNYHFGGGAYDIEKALSYYERALALEPELQGAHYQRGRVYFIKREFQLAISDFNRELELYPDYKRTYYVRGLVYGYQKNYPAAAADFKAFLATKPDSWAGYNDLAWVYFQEGKYADARDAARAGLATDEGNPWLLNSLGVALLNLGEKEGAKETLERAARIAESMSPSDWGNAYPGNDPRIYAEGLAKMKASIRANLELL